MDDAGSEGLTITPDTFKQPLDGPVDALSPAVSRAHSVRLVHVSIPSVSSGQNQQSVIQSTQPVVQFSKNNVILLNKGGSVIQSTPNSSVQSLQVLDAEPVPTAQYEDEAARRRREILTRRPSYRKILNDLGGGEISEDKGDGDVEGATASYQGNGIIKVIPANTIQISGAESVQGLQSLSMSSAGTGGNTIVQYTQGDGQFFVPVSIPVTGGLKLDQGGSQHMVLTTSTGEVVEEVTKKREVRLYKNREAARECRRKKKEYIKCLENRVAVLENQNKALIEELKSLKELYCQKKLP